MKPKQADESFVDMKFPAKGIDVSTGFGMQQPGTTPEGTNVRLYEPGTDRARGGQRPGLAKYISTQPNGSQLIQELATVVSVGTTPPVFTSAAPILKVQSNSVSQAGVTLPVTNTFTNAVVAGNAVFVIVESNSVAGVTTVTDSKGNTYTKAIAAVSGNQTVDIWYSLNVLGGASFVVTVNFAATNGNIGFAIVEASGVATASAVDATSSASGVITPAAPGAISTAQPIEIAFIAMSSTNGGTVTPPSGWTALTTIAGSFPESAMYQIFSSGQFGLNPSWTIPGVSWVAAIASFKNAGTLSVQSSQSGRIVTLVAVSGGNVYSALAGSTVWNPAINTTGLTLATTGIVRSAPNNQKLYFADGTHALYFDPATNAMGAWAATAGTMPVDSASNKPRLIETWRGRTVLSGLPKDGQNWFMSAVGDPTDWDYFPTTPVATQAVAGNNSTLGKVGDIITALIPYSDDILIFGGDSSIWMCHGDPMAGGQIDRVSDAIGMAWGAPWTKGPDGTLYFFSNKMGIYSMTPGQSLPQRISQQIDALLADVNTGTYGIRMLWDDVVQGLHVFISLVASAAATTHYFWEQRAGAWWQDEFTTSNHNPLVCCSFDGNLPTDRKSLIGSWDGYVRSMDPDTITDDSTAIASSVVIGPLLTKDLDDVLLKDVQGILGESSGDVTYAVYVGSTAEAALASTPVVTGTWSAGRNLNTYVRASGHAVYVRLTATTYWAMETIRARVAGKGKVRRRGY